jgi:hypothetical protein
MNRIRLAVTLVALALGLVSALPAHGEVASDLTTPQPGEVPEPPPPPPGRSAHATLRGGSPPAVRGHGTFREIGAALELVLMASDALPGRKQVSLVHGSSCRTLEEIDDAARRLGELTIGDDGRGRLTARLTGVSIEPRAANTVIDALLVVHVHDRRIEACGRVLVGRLAPSHDAPPHRARSSALAVEPASIDR